MKKQHAIARAIAAAMTASTLLAGLANASGGSAPKAKEKGEAEEGAELSSRSMDAPYLAVPVVRDGTLVNYLFVSIRIEVANGVDLWQTRERAHFLRDALVRASHAHDLADPNNTNALNEARALEVYRAAAIQALGERAVGQVSIVATYSSQGSGV
jgi:flagellar basal body-associated protein FliL